jgi:hypothetical protein
LTDDPETLASIVRASIEEFDEPGKIAAYALLADVAGVEAVWALDLDHSGSLEAMDPHVRESMATGNAEPLLAAACAMPVDDGSAGSLTRRSANVPDMPPGLAWSRTDEALDHPLTQPLQKLIRARLDGHVDRWLELAELLRTRPDLSDEELIDEVAPGSS